MDHTSKHDHFQGKSSIEHVAEAQVEGILSSAEIHGTEIPGHLSAGADAARDMAVFLLLIGVLLHYSQISHQEIFFLLTFLACGWCVWRTGRSAWLGWYRLERLHRILEQEKWEIEHNRLQEKEELMALYGAKGFEGQLLEDVVAVLMADSERLLRVMIEEELRLSLHSQEHPLKQSLGAFLGSLATSVFIGIGFLIEPKYGFILGAFVSIAISAAISARFIGNRLVPAIIWNAGIASLALGFTYFLYQFFERV